MRKRLPRVSVTVQRQSVEYSCGLGICVSPSTREVMVMVEFFFLVDVWVRVRWA